MNYQAETLFNKIQNLPHVQSVSDRTDPGKLTVWVHDFHKSHGFIPTSWQGYPVVLREVPAAFGNLPEDKPNLSPGVALFWIAIALTSIGFVYFARK